MKIIKKYWFIATFIMILFLPIYGTIIDADLTLRGVTVSKEKVEISKKTLGDGTYQTYLNDCWEDQFPGKKALLKVRNQILYSFLKTSPNGNVVIGKEEYLFEPFYILRELQIYTPAKQEYFDALGDKLTKLKALLEEYDKELYVFITPSKAHFCREYIPEDYKFLDNRDAYDYSEYQKIVETLKKSEIPYYDSIAFIHENLNSGIFESAPFGKTGIHWNHVWGARSGANFLDYMRSNSKYDLSKIEVQEEKSDVPLDPDADLYNSLNLLKNPTGPWYQAHVEVVHEGEDKPNVFMRGGSFMGQSLSHLIRANVFDKNVHFENSYYFTNTYSDLTYLSSSKAYDELDIDKLMGETDILILEVNENAISFMSWEFIDYLLEHPEFIDRNER